MRRGLLLLLLLGACSSTPRPTEYRLQRIRAGEELYLLVNGHRVCVLDKGSGPPVLLLHVLGGSSYDWRNQIDALARKSFRVIAVDLLGSGYTDRPSPGDYTPDGQVELVRAVMDRLGLRRSHVIGASYGGGLALIYALKYPERVDRLVLIDPAVIPKSLHPLMAGLLLPVIGEVAYAIVPTSWLVYGALHRAYYDPTKIREKDAEEYIYENSFPGNDGAKLAMMRRMDDAIGLQHRIGEVRAATLILWGEEDRITPPKNADEVAQGIPGSLLITIPLTGHLPQMERPEVVNRVLLRFLKGRYDREGLISTPAPDARRQGDRHH